MRYFGALLFLAVFALNLSAQSVQVKAEPLIEQMMTQYATQNKARTAVTGWRVQILATTDRQQLDRTQQSFQYHYPNIPVGWVHSRPYYRLRAGAFRTKLEALRLKYILGQEYDGLYLVRDDQINPRELLNYY